MRRTTTLKLDESCGRDKGKSFVITEMDAYSAQDWATRLLFALARNGVQLPEGGLESGMAGLAGIGITALLKSSYAEVRPLAQELLTCVKYKHGPTIPEQAIEPGPNCVIEEIWTFYKLYAKAFELHVGFSTPVPTPTSA
jgi:hypothetical protein